MDKSNFIIVLFSVELSINKANYAFPLNSFAASIIAK